MMALGKVAVVKLNAVGGGDDEEPPAPPPQPKGTNAASKLAPSKLKRAAVIFTSVAATR